MRNNRAHGFTLLELLVAMAIFSILSVLAYGALNTILDNRVATNKAADRLAEVQLAMLRMSDDLRQIAPRRIRSEYGDKLPAIKTEIGLGVEWSRAGYQNPAHLKRSNLQRIGYQLTDSILYRLQWLVLDRAQDSSPQKLALLHDVSAMEWRFMTSDGSWSSQWPPANAEVDKEYYPRAVEVNLELKDWGKIRRLILLTDDNPHS